MVKAFRAVSFIEGLSFLALLLIAMPLKYVWGMPEAVRVTGSIHGGLFLVFMVVLFQAAMQQRWSMKKSGILFVSSVLPLGFLIVERMHKKGEL